MGKTRLVHELPECIAEWGWKFHHVGIPTDEQKEGENYLPHLKFYAAGFESNPFGIEWMRYDKDCKLPELVKKVAHLAFEVVDLDWELTNRSLNVIIPPNPPSEGVKVAVIEYNGAPVELIEFEKNKRR